MRIIAGAHKGRALQAPKGDVARPTLDRTREALFNILEHGDYPPLAGARVIDLFAGSGALGLEAMSRGAAFALFVETNPAARGAIRDNIEALGLFGNTRIHRRDAVKLGAKPAGLGGPFTLAFLDPPYGQGLIGPALEALADGDWLAPGAACVAECAASEPELSPLGFETVESRTYGDSRLTFLRREG